MISLDFEVQHQYEETAAGILVPCTLLHGGREVDLKARLDTGASDCVFDHYYAQALGIDMEAGYPRSFRTLTGLFTAYGHEVTLRSLDLE